MTISLTNCLVVCGLTRIYFVVLAIVIIRFGSSPALVLCL